MSGFVVLILLLIGCSLFVSFIAYLVLSLSEDDQ